MRIRITNPTHFWHHEFIDQEFEVCEGYTPDHHQYPVMTQYGRTWFDVNSVTVVEGDHL